MKACCYLSRMASYMLVHTHNVDVVRHTFPPLSIFTNLVIDHAFRSQLISQCAPVGNSSRLITESLLPSCFRTKSFSATFSYNFASSLLIVWVIKEWPGIWVLCKTVTFSGEDLVLLWRFAKRACYCWLEVLSVMEVCAHRNVLILSIVRSKNRQYCSNQSCRLVNLRQIDMLSSVYAHGDTRLQYSAGSWLAENNVGSYPEILMSFLPGLDPPSSHVSALLQHAETLVNVLLSGALLFHTWIRAD